MATVEDLVRKILPEDKLRLVVSNVGVTPGFSSIYTSNSASHTAFVRVGLNKGHKVGSYEYMDRVRTAIRKEMSELMVYFQSPRAKWFLDWSISPCQRRKVRA